MSPELRQLTLRHLGGSLILALALSLGAAGLLTLARHHQTRVKLAHEAARSQSRQLHERYLATSRDEALIRATLGHFDALSQSGLIGPEHRLDWANTLRAAAQSRRLANLEFSITPQRSLGKLDAAGQYNLQSSQMKLRLGLLHEGDLLFVLDTLIARPDALLYPRHCLLSRTTARPGSEGESLQAECELDWNTISPPSPAPHQP